jgi:hypothetical protein
MFYSSNSHIQSALTMIRSGYDGGSATRFNFRADFRQIGKWLPPNAKVLMHTYRPNLGIEREVFMDWAGQQGLFSYEPLRDARGVHEMWRSHGMTHVLHLPGREAPSKQEDVLFHDYLAHYTKTHKAFGGYDVVEIPAAAPPALDHPYRVLVVGLGTYKDGLYPLEALNTYEGVPKHLIRWNPPTTPWPKDPAAATALVDDAEAVLLGAKPALDPAVKQHLDALFPVTVAKGRSLTIYYRKKDAAAAADATHGSTSSDPLDPSEEH